MSEASKKHIEDALNKIRVIFEAAEERIEAQQIGSTIAATILAKELGEPMGISGPEMYPTLRFLYRDYPNRWLRKGSSGGLYFFTPEDLAKKNATEATKTVK